MQALRAARRCAPAPSASPRSTSPAHNGEGGMPMPSRLADEREMRALVGALGEAGRGVFMLTKGGAHAVPFLEELAAASGRPVMVAALLHNSTNPDARVRRPRRDRAQPTRAATQLLGAGRRAARCRWTSRCASPYPFEGLQSWQPALAARGRGAISAELARPAFRDALRDEIARAGALSPVQRRMGQGASSRSSGASTRPRAADHRRARARRSGGDPLDFMLDLALDEDLDTMFNALLLNTDEDAVGQHAAPPAQPGHPVRRRRAPHLLQRRRLRPAPARPLGARARQR